MGNIISERYWNLKLSSIIFSLVLFMHSIENFFIAKLNINLFKKHLKVNRNLGRKMSITFRFFALCRVFRKIWTHFFREFACLNSLIRRLLRYIAMLLISINHGGQQKPNTCGKNILHLIGFGWCIFNFLAWRRFYGFWRNCFFRTIGNTHGWLIYFYLLCWIYGKF